MRSLGSARDQRGGPLSIRTEGPDRARFALARLREGDSRIDQGTSATVSSFTLETHHFFNNSEARRTVHTTAISTSSGSERAGFGRLRSFDKLGLISRFLTPFILSGAMLAVGRTAAGRWKTREGPKTAYTSAQKSFSLQTSERSLCVSTDSAQSSNVTLEPRD